MISIGKLLGDIERARAQAGAALAGARSILADPLRLGALLAEGERRRRASELRLGVPVPRFCIFSVTWRCNLDCAGCYASGYARKREFSPAEIARVIREATDLGSFFFVIVGGEPLLMPGLIDVLAAETRAVFFLFTNATLLSPAHAEAFARADHVVPVISVEGDRRLTDLRRGGGVGLKVASAMDLLRGANVPFAFSSMVTRRNLAQVTGREWLDEIWAAGARFGFLIDYVPVGAQTVAEFVLTEEDRKAKTAAVAARYAEARPLVMNIPPDEYDGGPCQAAGRGMVHINADGFVEPCPFSHFAADNVRERPLAEILGSPFMKRLREAVEYLDNPCGECLMASHENLVRSLAGECGAFQTDR